jgi:hypothetical protein
MCSFWMFEFVLCRFLYHFLRYCFSFRLQRSSSVLLQDGKCPASMYGTLKIERGCAMGNKLARKFPVFIAFIPAHQSWLSWLVRIHSILSSALKSRFPSVRGAYHLSVPIRTYRTVRDFYSPGNFFAYVAWYKKADKKIKTLKFAVGYVELCSQSVQLLTQ